MEGAGGRTGSAKRTDFQAFARRTGRDKGTEYGGDPAADGGSDAPAV